MHPEIVRSPPLLLVFIGVPCAVTVASLAVFVACSSGGEAASGGTRPDSSTTIVATPDAPPGPSCAPLDIVPGTGKKFCELPGTDATALTVPPEFCVREFTTTPVIEARVLRFAPNGDLFVAAPSMDTPGGASDGPGAIVVLPDDDGDGRADAVVTYAGPSPRNGSTCTLLDADPNNFACVHGLLFSGGYLYFTRSDEVRRFPYVAGQRAAPPATSELVAKLGGENIVDVRWTHTLEQTKSGSIYVSRGRTDSSGCDAEQMGRGAVFALHVEGTAALPLTPEVVANGFRNPMYLRCSPSTCGECYAAELTGDNWDGVGGREKLALLEQKGESWGYPCCVGRDVAAPTAKPDASCASVGRELVSIPLHDTPFGLDFDRGGFPDPYKHGLFVALHGVRTSFGGTGVVFMRTDPTSMRPTGEAKLFVDGFGGGSRIRATDVAFAPDGRLFVADDTTGKIFWVAPRTLAAQR
jgi:glucose/arabinose dehydrogenase